MLYAGPELLIASIALQIFQEIGQAYQEYKKDHKIEAWLISVIRSSLNKEDQELNNPYAHMDVPNCIQVLEVMKALHIQEIKVVHTTTTKGMVIGSE